MEPTSSDPAPRRDPRADCGRPDLAHRLAAGEDLSGAFGAEIAAHAQGCQACSVRLSLVQQAELWLGQSSSNRGGLRSATPCPVAEELFDYGRGPGAQQLAVATERRIEAHLVDCEDCRGLVATLAHRPPAPLLDRGLPPADEREPARPRLAPAPRPWRAAWVPLAAAAVVVVAGIAWWRSAQGLRGAESDLVASGAGTPTEIEYPRFAVLRGDVGQTLRYPRGDVLSAPGGGPGTWHSLRFEIEPQAGATGYRVELRRLPEGLEGDEVLVDKLSSEVPEFEWGGAGARTLPQGEYVWEAWAVVNELERGLGRQDFYVVEDAAAHAKVSELGKLDDPERSSRILAWLVAAGYVTDAHAFAAGFERTPARDEFLRAVPQR